MMMPRMLGLLLVALLTAATAGCSGPSPSFSAPVETATVAASPAEATSATATPAPRPAETPALCGQELLGESWQGRPIVGHWFGQGAHKVVVVGNIHGGTEENTYELALELIAYFENNVREVTSDVTLWIIPTANPDGLANDTRATVGWWI